MTFRPPKYGKPCNYLNEVVETVLNANKCMEGVRSLAKEEQ
jgi:hypothetical protein